MSECNFHLPFSEPAAIAVQKARAAVESQNGTFNGNDLSGEFEVNIFGNTIKGSYKVAGQILNLIISHKPFFVPCSTIESFLLNHIS